MKRFVLGLFLTTLLLPGTTALAATACFDYSCISGTCDFDASCSSASPFIWRYVFDYGDGAGLTTSDPTQTHTYSVPDAFFNTRNVTVTILYFDGPGETAVNCDVPVIHTVGPQDFITGRCTHSD